MLDELPFRCTIGILSDSCENQYIAILNRDYLSARTFCIPLKDNFRIYEVSKADSKHYCINDSTDILNITLEPSDMAFLRIQKPSDEVCGIEYIPE